MIERMDWPHAPLHRVAEGGIYFITAGTYQKQHHYRSSRALEELQRLLFAAGEKHHVCFHAWALLSSHYHLIVETRENLQPFIKRFHSVAAIERNRRDGTAGRRVWYQYRDTQLTYERSYLARLKYVNENAVHHGLVLRATNYRWCSATWFEERAERAFVRSVHAMKIDEINVLDDFEAVWDV